MIEAVIFDMDGVMFDTEKLSEEAWIAAGEKAGFNITDEHISKIRGLNADKSKELFDNIFGSKFDFYSVRQTCVDYVNAYIDKNGVPIKEGLIELLEYLSHNDIKIVLATATENKTAVYLLSAAGVLQYFDKLICGDMVTKGKPDPEIYLKAVESIDSCAENCIAIEDSPNGINSAYNAGCKVIMVPDIDQPTDELEKMLYYKADTLIDVRLKIQELEGIHD